MEGLLCHPSPKPYLLKQYRHIFVHNADFPGVCVAVDDLLEESEHQDESDHTDAQYDSNENAP